MKRMVAVTLVFLSIICLVACAAAEDSSDQTNIQQMTVRYTADGENYRSIKADFRRNEKTVTDDSGSTSEKATRKLEDSGDLLRFLEDIVVPAMTVESVQPEADSEMQIIWSIRIVTASASLCAEGFEGDTFPDYWDELLRYLEP